MYPLKSSQLGAALVLSLLACGGCSESVTKTDSETAPDSADSSVAEGDVSFSPDGGDALKCGADNTCEVNCIECDSACPCAPGRCLAQCSNDDPDPVVVATCEGLNSIEGCLNYQSGGYPAGCRWNTLPFDLCPLPKPPPPR